MPIDKRKPAGGWKASLKAVLKQHNGAKAVGGSVASFATQQKRSDVLFAAFTELRQLGYKLDTVHSFAGRHVEALAKAWEARGLAPATIQNHISTLRVFAGWIGKPGMVEAAERYVSRPGAASRSSINTRDKSWDAAGVEVTSKIDQVRAKDERVALQLELQAAFGLRVLESIRLRPHLADHGSYLLVNLGTKGGRDRIVPIDTPEKRTVLDLAKSIVVKRTDSTANPDLTLKQARNRYYNVVRACGISRDEGITSHGLRHAYASDRYRQISGEASPVQGGASIDRDTDRATRLEIAEELGHSRESVTTHYLGR